MIKAFMSSLTKTKCSLFIKGDRRQRHQVYCPPEIVLRGKEEVSFPH